MIFGAQSKGADMPMLSGESGGSPLSTQCMKLLIYLIKEFEKQSYELQSYHEKIKVRKEKYDITNTYIIQNI